MGQRRGGLVRTAWRPAPWNSPPRRGLALRQAPAGPHSLGADPRPPRAPSPLRPCSVPTRRRPDPDPFVLPVEVCLPRGRRAPSGCGDTSRQWSDTRHRPHHARPTGTLLRAWDHPGRPRVAETAPHDPAQGLQAVRQTVADLRPADAIALVTASPPVAGRSEGFSLSVATPHIQELGSRSRCTTDL